MIEQTRRVGTRAAKVCGAGGGGCVVFMVEPGCKPAVDRMLTRMGGQVIPFSVSRPGLEVRSNHLEATRL